MLAPSATMRRQNAPTQTSNMTQTQTQASATVLEYRCMFTHDILKKQKKWHDGSLRFHTFNRRVMVYDESKNLVGDLHYRQSEEFGEGLEFQLDRPVLVQVEEPMGQTTTDLNQVLAPNRQRQDVATGTTARTSPRQMRANLQRINAATSQGKAKSIRELLGASQRPFGRAKQTTQSPYEERVALAEVHNRPEPVAKRQKLAHQKTPSGIPETQDRISSRGDRQTSIARPTKEIPSVQTQPIELSSDDEDVPPVQIRRQRPDSVSARQVPIEESPVAALKPLSARPQQASHTEHQSSGTRGMAQTKSLSRASASNSKVTQPDSMPTSSRAIQSMQRKSRGPKSSLSLSTSSKKRQKLLCLNLPPSTVERRDQAAQQAVKLSANKAARRERLRFLVDSDTEDLDDPQEQPTDLQNSFGVNHRDIKPAISSKHNSPSPESPPPSLPPATAYVSDEEDNKSKRADYVSNSPMFFQSQVFVPPQFSDLDKSDDQPALPPSSRFCTTPKLQAKLATPASSPTSTVASSPGFLDLATLRNRATTKEVGFNHSSPIISHHFGTDVVEDAGAVEDTSDVNIVQRTPSPSFAQMLNTCVEPPVQLERSIRSPTLISHTQMTSALVMPPPAITQGSRRKNNSPFRRVMSEAIPPSPSFGDFPDESDLQDLLHTATAPATRNIASDPVPVPVSDPDVDVSDNVNWRGEAGSIGDDVEATNMEQNCEPMPEVNTTPPHRLSDLGLSTLVETGPWSTFEAFMLFEDWPVSKNRPNLGSHSGPVLTKKVGERAMNKKYGMFGSAKFVSQK